MIPRVVRQKNIVMRFIGPGTKNDCTGDGQQQFARSDQTEELCLNKIRRLLSKHDIKTVHIPVKENIHMVRPTKVKVGLSHWDMLYLTSAIKCMLGRRAKPLSSGARSI
jgi:sialic acid synthase SpsE